MGHHWVSMTIKYKGTSRPDAPLRARQILHSASGDTDNALSVQMGNITAPNLSKSKLSSRHSLKSVGHVSTLIVRVYQNVTEY